MCLSEIMKLKNGFQEICNGELQSKKLTVVILPCPVRTEVSCLRGHWDAIVYCYITCLSSEC